MTHDRPAAPAAALFGAATNVRLLRCAGPTCPPMAQSLYAARLVQCRVAERIDVQRVARAA